MHTNTRASRDGRRGPGEMSNMRHVNVDTSQQKGTKQPLWGRDAWTHHYTAAAHQLGRDKHGGGKVPLACPAKLISAAHTASIQWRHQDKELANACASVCVCVCVCVCGGGGGGGGCKSLTIQYGPNWSWMTVAVCLKFRLISCCLFLMNFMQLFACIIKAQKQNRKLRCQK